MNKILIYLFSIILIFVGIDTIWHPTLYEPISIFGIKTLAKGGDVTAIKWEVGILFIIIGILLFYSEYRKKINIKNPKYSKCPKCKEVFNFSELENGKCKYCKDIDTIDIDKYFKQYLKSNDNE